MSDRSEEDEADLQRQITDPANRDLRSYYEQEVYDACAKERARCAEIARRVATEIKNGPRVSIWSQAALRIAWLIDGGEG